MKSSQLIILFVLVILCLVGLVIMIHENQRNIIWTLEQISNLQESVIQLQQFEYARQRANIDTDDKSFDSIVEIEPEITTELLDRDADGFYRYGWHRGDGFPECYYGDTCEDTLIE